MQKTIQRIGAFFLLLAFTASGLLYLLFDVAQVRYKFDAACSISGNNQIETVKVPVSELHNNADDREIWEQGRLYDIQSYVIINDTAFVSVYHDAHEEGLVKEIAACFEPNEPVTGSHSDHISKTRSHMPGTDKLLPDIFSIGFLCTASVNLPSPPVTACLSRIVSGVITPPPEYVS